MAAIKSSGFMGGGTITESTIGSRDVQEAQSDSFKVMAMVRAFMTHGHLKADLDPLKLDEAYAEMDLGGTYGHPNAEM